MKINVNKSASSTSTLTWLQVAVISAFLRPFFDVDSNTRAQVNQTPAADALECDKCVCGAKMTVILREVKLKIELPCGCSRRVFSLFVHESEAQLDYLEQIHIAAQ